MFYIAVDNHFIGDDGFVVPKDFTEFYTRFPDHIQKWVKKRMYTGISQDEADDWAQDLTIHLQSLPKESKHRDDGKVDIVQTFDPFRQYGASQRRFMCYINFCLMNKFRTVGSKFSRNPLSRTDNISLSSSELEDHNGESTKISTEEFVYQHSNRLSKASQKDFKAQDDQMFTGEFLEFVGKKDHEVAPLLHAVLEGGGSFADTRHYWCVTCERLSNLKEIQSGIHTGHALGIEQKEFNRFRGRLKELAVKFVREV